MNPSAKARAKRIADRETEILLLLREIQDWLRPMDVGGRDGSHHSRTLAKLCRRGLVKRQRRASLMNFLGSRRGSWEYRLTTTGRAAADALEAERVARVRKRK